MKVCVIMSTYNGKKYLQEQLDSIFNQDIEAEIIVFVRDDDSKDSTIEFIKDYREKNKVNICIERGKNCGPADSFLDAIRNCPRAEYYAFCDQDDVWDTSKLSIAISEIKEVEYPCLWFSNYSVVDSELNVLVEHAIKEPRLDDLQMLFFNNVPGCVMVFNDRLLLELRKIKIEHIRMHDIMALNIALICGKVIFNQNSYIKYRQHNSNVIGYNHKKVKINKWLRQKLSLIMNKEKYSIADYSEQILKHYSLFLDERQVKEYNLIALTRHSIVARLRILNREYLKMKLGRTSISIRCKILLGLI
ncbi:glycosyltransferase [Clostridium sp. SM-530-WT-3G]|uniref:glycosyltransferase n=1 Tax=Clostridium sp. SM-530-WT-3G TaxID=2725303 RepID=UPI00145C500A|nr:glycosyltransferase [Clostridium sp. SM-530-WT-3G]NME83738.1 glycosyltransferase [Clostridium sp. SM-530-WT-3G]